MLRRLGLRRGLPATFPFFHIAQCYVDWSYVGWGNVKSFRLRFLGFQFSSFRVSPFSRFLVFLFSRFLVFLFPV